MTTAPERNESTGLANVLGTGDHKTLGRLWLGFGATFFVITAVVGALVALERITPADLDVVGADHVMAFFTLYRVGLVLFVALPLFIGLATFVVPLQVGSRSVAFPRAAAAALWGWLLGSVIVIIAYAGEGGPGGTDAEASELWLVGLALITVSLLLATVSIVATVIALRTPMMSLLQVPAFSWSMLVAGTLWLLTLPVFVGGLGLAWLDLANGQLQFGTSEGLWPHLAWAFEQPQIYVVAIPVLGIVGDIVPTALGVAQRGRGIAYGAIAGFGALSFGAWAQSGLRPDLLTEAPYVAFGLAAILPVVVLIIVWGDTVGRGSLRPSGPLIAADAALMLVLIAVLVGGTGVIEDFALVGTTWQAAQLNLTALGAVAGVIAGLIWWGPKIWGRRVPSGLAVLGGGLVLVGALTLAVGQGAAGLLDQPLLGFGSDDLRDGVEALNVVAAIGALIVAVGAVALVGLIVRSMVGAADDSAADPWEGQTLEWATTSPPPVDNFDGPVDEVTSATPLLAEEAAG